MRIAVEGCCHGELDKIYETVQFLERANNFKIDLLLICGDFQAVRNHGDLRSMAVPSKFQKLNTFYKYYSGEKEAPVLTVFIGGNHEASNYMQELPYGGWVAKNIYYLGYAGVIQVGGVRIGGLSGIYKARDFNKGHYEHPPYTEDTKRSVYHIRNLEVFRLKQLTRPVDIFMSHDWPTNIAHYGKKEKLFRIKPFLKREVLDGSLGSPPAEDLLLKLQPSYWFSAHLHVKFVANVCHSKNKSTKFLSLDKCLPRRKFLQVLDIPHREAGPLKIKLDPEWLCVLKSTNHLLNLRPTQTYMPGPGCSERYDFEVSDQDIQRIQSDFGNDLTLPENFQPTAPTLHERGSRHGGSVLVNPQTSLLCSMLDITDPNAVHLGVSSHGSFNTSTTNPDKIAIDSDDDTDDVGDSNGDDDASPSDINSSLDASCLSSNTSYINSSLDMSNSFSTVEPKSHVSRFSGSTSTPKKFSTILAAQRQKVSDDDDELASILTAQRQAREKSLADSSTTEDTDVATSSGTDEMERRSGQVDSSSQDSQEADSQTAGLSNAGGGLVRVDSSQSDLKSAVTPEVVTVSAELENMGQLSTNKRPSPSDTCSESAGKKLKRRNVSFYTAEAGDEAS